MGVHHPVLEAQPPVLAPGAAAVVHPERLLHWFLALLSLEVRPGSDQASDEDGGATRHRPAAPLSKLRTRLLQERTHRLKMKTEAQVRAL